MIAAVSGFGCFPDLNRRALSAETARCSFKNRRLDSRQAISRSVPIGMLTVPGNAYSAWLE